MYILCLFVNEYLTQIFTHYKSVQSAEVKLPGQIQYVLGYVVLSLHASLLGAQSEGASGKLTV